MPRPPRPPQRDLRITILLPDGASEQRRLGGDGLVVGRDPGCDLVVPAATSWRVSRHHLRLERLADGWWAEDLASTNGTWVGSLRLHGRRRLRSGDRLRLADHFRTGGFVFSIHFPTSAFRRPS